MSEKDLTACQKQLAVLKEYIHIRRMVDTVGLGPTTKEILIQAEARLNKSGVMDEPDR
jgi:hypothetical protein